MANRYWVGGTGTWDASSTAHWSASSGGASGASVPGSGDVAIFDANSGSGTVTVSSNPAVGGLNSAGASIAAFAGTVDVFSGAVSLGRATTLSVAAGRSITLTCNGFTVGLSTFDGQVTCLDAFYGLPILGSSAALILKNGVTSTITTITWPASVGSAQLKSDLPGTRATLSDAVGTNNVNNISVTDISFAGGATWYWGTGYTDGGNNTGISLPPAVKNNPLFMVFA